MSDFGGKRWRPYLDEETQERRDEILDHLQEKYDGPSDFLKQKLMEEKALSIDERIERKEQKQQEVENDLERLKRIKNEREQQSQLRDKRELLKEKQEKLREIADSGSKSFEAVCRDAMEKSLKRKPNHLTEKEYLCNDYRKKKIGARIESALEKENDRDVDELVSDVQRLQREIEELNGGPEGYFMSLEKVEGEEIKGDSSTVATK